MRVWCYEKETGALIASPYADKGFSLEYSLTELPYFFYASEYTELQPPEYGANQIPCYEGNKWKVKKDYRKYIAWHKSDGKRLRITELDVEPSSEYITVKPEGLYLPVYDETLEAWREKTEKEIYADAYAVDRDSAVEAMRHECQLALENKYYRKELPFGGLHVRADLDSQKIITGYMAELSFGSRTYPVLWIACENVSITISTQEQMIQMVSAMSQWIEQSIFACRQAKDAIDDASNFEDAWATFIDFRDAEI